jgi:hypothetical protein
MNEATMDEVMVAKRMVNFLSLETSILTIGLSAVYESVLICDYYDLDRHQTKGAVPCRKDSSEQNAQHFESLNLI